MAKKKNKIEATTQSIFDKMQEVYRDCQNQKRDIIQKMETRVAEHEAEDVEDAAKLGKIENDSMKLVNDLIDKKIKLLELHRKVAVQEMKNRKAAGLDADKIPIDGVALTQKEMAALRTEMKEEINKKRKYKLDD